MTARRNDAADDEVERVARIFCADRGLDPDERDMEGDPRWREFIETAVSAIAAWKVLTQ